MARARRSWTRRRARARARALRLLRRIWSRRRGPALYALGLALGCVLLVNSLVRVLGGGSPNPLSPLHFADKLHALSGLGVHGLRHVFGDPHPDARATVLAAAARNRVPASLALAVARAESRFDPHAISHTGAMGLMQLMPDTAEKLGVRDAFDPVENADGGTRYLHRLLARYHGNRRRAIAAYNAGPARVPLRGRGALPAETHAYVRAVLGTAHF